MVTAPLSLSTGQLSAVSRLFSPRVIQEMARKGKSPIFSRLVVESSLADVVASSEPVRKLFDVAFSLLKRKNYRNEYVYKSAITHKILLGHHSLRTAAMLSEFRVGSCRADTVILNGTSTVYEIKSERDNLDRLQTQIAAYRQVFAKVNIITGQNHLKEILAIVPLDVGILLLSDRFQISTIREAIDTLERIVPVAIFDSLRLHESQRILESMGMHCPAVANTQLHQTLRRRFANLEAHRVHACMVRVLRETRSLLPLAELVEAVPSSLQATAFSTPLRRQDHARLLGAMNVPLRDALEWK